LSQTIDQLHRHANCSDFCHEFLNLIQCDMWVVDSSKRLECYAVWKRLRKMLNQCRMDKVYAVVGKPWLNAPGSVSQPMAVKIRKANNTLLTVETELENASEAAQTGHPREKDVNRNKRNKRRDRRGRLQPDHIRC
jgi:hypothetical protein